jgi:tetratricopeptide (TPR) repeat protein
MKRALPVRLLPSPAWRSQPWGYLACLFLIGLPTTAWAQSEKPPSAEDDPAALARRLLLRGNYAEAGELYQGLAESSPVIAARGLAQCQAAVGNRTEATATLAAALDQLADGVDDPGKARLSADLAQLALDSGDRPKAAQWVASALALDTNCLPARWLEAELHRVAGRIDEALAGYKWVYGYYTTNDVDDPEDLRAAGLALAQHARWERRKGDFSVLVNDLYPFCLQAEPAYWPAEYERGLLFLEKFNQAEASRSLKKALEMNPNAAEVHAALARLALRNYNLDEASLAIDRALSINPNLAEAHRLKSDMLAANFQLAAALAALDPAVALDPLAEETLGRVAACYLALDGSATDPAASRFAVLVKEMTDRNPHCGTFYATLAERLVEVRKYPDAERFYLQAIELMPQLVPPYSGLGMLYMRLGREVEGQDYLTRSFEIDPANERVKNMLEVLDVLAGYAVLETEHFVLKFDRGQDELLARYAARYLEEEVYPALTRQFGFEPEGKSLFEVFNKAKSTSGHGWFSARMVGLPYISTVGACAGKMVAMTSPNGLDQKFNWARVLKHEFVHVLNLQQTRFNIPHWYTEALATLNEQYPRPQVWNELLASRVPAGELFDLDTINLGFIRPQSSLDWQMAYCQAELYAEYMLAAYGDDALAKMLTAYADNLSTRDGLRRCFNVEQADFEAGYRTHLEQVVAGLSKAARPPEMTLAELVRAHEAAPDDSDLAARLAQAWLARKSYPKARELARAVRKAQPSHPLAGYVLARIHLVVGETTEALELLEASLDEAAPNEDVLNLLASLRVKAEDHAEAARLYELGAKNFPQDSRWTKGLARVYLVSGDDARLALALARLAEMDADDATVRKKLAQLALAGRDFAAADRWANQANHIDVQDPDIHRMLAEAAIGMSDPASAVEEYGVAIELKPKDPALRLALAKVCLATDRAGEARQALEALLELDPEHAEARELLGGLAP